MVEVPGSGSQWSPGGGWSLGPGRYYTHQPGLTLTPEMVHLLISGGIGVIARNPYVSVGVGILHGLGHVFEPSHNPYGPSFTEWITGTYVPLSPGGGGPGQSLTSTVTPPSVEEVGRMITSGGRFRKRCPTGMVWSPRHKKCILDITWGTDQYTRKSR